MSYAVSDPRIGRHQFLPHANYPKGSTAMYANAQHLPDALFADTTEHQGAARSSAFTGRSGCRDMSAPGALLDTHDERQSAWLQWQERESVNRAAYAVTRLNDLTVDVIGSSPVGPTLEIPRRECIPPTVRQLCQSSAAACPSSILARPAVSGCLRFAALEVCSQPAFVTHAISPASVASPLICRARSRCERQIA